MSVVCVNKSFGASQKIVITGNSGGFIESQTVKANILYKILNMLKELVITIEK